MPYKSSEQAKINKRKYYLENRQIFIDKAVERARLFYSGTAYYKYAQQKKKARQRGIEWKFTFEDWCEVWQDSGKWGERGQTGFVMCRKGDVGPYSIDNVYIDKMSVNSLDQIKNNKGPYQTRSC